MLNSDALNQLKQLKQDISKDNPRHEATVKGSMGRFGFAVLDDGRQAFLIPDEMAKVLPGDRVRVELSKDEKDRDTATIEKVLKSELRYVVGRYVIRGKGHFVEPDASQLSRRVFLPPKARKGASEGDLILCRITRHPFEDQKPQAEVVRIIGREDTPHVETEYCLSKHGLSAHARLPKIGDAQVAAWQKQIEKAMSRREDLRALPFVTIDSASTQDMDDALCAEATDDGWTLHVAIADPAELVEPGGEIDQRAQRLGSSWYFPDRIIPMLPDVLSTELCSLVPGQDRLALVMSLQVKPDGQISDFRLCEAVIHSRAKLAYSDVAGLMAEGAEHVDTDSLKALEAVRQALNNYRDNHALVAEDRQDYRLILNEAGKIDHIERRDSLDAHNLVEEAMIATNRCAARFLREKGLTGPFITHAGFRPERLDAMDQIRREQLGDDARFDLTDWKGFKAFLQALDEKDSELPLRGIATRSLARSLLSPEAAPHFGMGLALYTTFTSPLRKYNDLLVHRQIKAVLHGQKPQKVRERDCEHLQEALRLGRQAVNETEQWLKCQYMADQDGALGRGRIVHVNGAGFQVRLDNTGVEGFVHLGEEDEKFSFDPVYLTQKSATRTFMLDQTVMVEVAGVDWDRRQVKFRLTDDRAADLLDAFADA
ncbi:MAG: VacB/RNase II family 3'-5' exoribonuclease [Gammaproteobacteria bacterium]|nr:MAG: VacB/RNase II family 3'-5' exoribonuclease [Gammaproteobacteria bacterium]